MTRDLRWLRSTSSVQIRTWITENPKSQDLRVYENELRRRGAHGVHNRLRRRR